MTRDELIEWAKTVDQLFVILRIIPRTLLISAWVFYVSYVIWVTVWYMQRVETFDPVAGFPDSIFAGGTIVGLGGILGSFQKLYQTTRGYQQDKTGAE